MIFYFGYNFVKCFRVSIAISETRLYRPGYQSYNFFWFIIWFLKGNLGNLYCNVCKQATRTWQLVSFCFISLFVDIFFCNVGDRGVRTWQSVIWFISFYFHIWFCPMCLTLLIWPDNAIDSILKLQFLTVWKILKLQSLVQFIWSMSFCIAHM